MIKIPSVEALHYDTFQNRKDELLLQWHRSNLKLESIALPTLNTKDAHCLQTEFFLVRAKPMIRFFFFFRETPAVKKLQLILCFPSWFAGRLLASQCDFFIIAAQQQHANISKKQWPTL